MKLFANKLGKLRLFGFFDYSLSKKEKNSPTVVQQHFFQWNFWEKNLGIGNFAFDVLYFMN